MARHSLHLAPHSAAGRPGYGAWVCAGLAWLAGHALLQWAPELPPAWCWAVLLALGLAAALWAWRWPRQAPAACLVAALAFALAHAGWRAQLRMAETLPAAWQGQTLAVQGRIAGLPQPLAGWGARTGWRLTLDVESLAAPGVGSPLPVVSRLSLSCFDLPSVPKADEQWRLHVRLRAAQGLFNPDLPDTSLWLLEQGVRVSGSCVREPAAQRLAAPRVWTVDHLRQRWRDVLYQQVSDPRQAGVLTALSVGEQAALSTQDWALMRDTGVAHLLSVSGLHITMLAWLARGLAQRLWQRSARLCLVLPAPRAARWLGVAAAALYTVFSGWGVPAQRTLWMLVLWALQSELGWRWPRHLSLLLIAAWICLWDPWAPVQPGFWLSFVAVAVLMAADAQTTQAASAPVVRPWWRSLWAALRVQLMISLALAPLSLVLFQQLSVVGVLANALAIPWVSWVVTPLSLLGALFNPLWLLGALAVQGLLLWLQWCQQLPLAVWRVPVAPLWTWAAALLGLLLLVPRWPLHWRAWGGLLLLPMLWPPLQRLPAGVLELQALDVGQGSAVLLRTRSHTLLFDAGPQWASGQDAGTRIVVPTLWAQGLVPLSMLMVSHADMDHRGGAAAVQRDAQPRRLLGALPQATPCLAGQRWQWDGVEFELLHPWPQTGAPTRRVAENERSCVLRVRAAGGSVLLPGDLPAAQEAQLVAAYGAAGLQSSVLMVPHHGSKSSSSKPFIEAVAPRWAVVQAGANNRFGHPALEVRQRYAALGVPLVNTAQCGAWRWRSDQTLAQTAEQGCARTRLARYWRPLPPPEPPAASMGPEQPLAAP
ncbi:DNA internalization-related competence protein ComEC/Rec2 [Roseateles sp. BYS180W]|uniref:DNA internalization-related competence protein ComEC/Rec2 n=1 Tax=Roseateles rivi TaxID=3299028 RepID=A0ABW7FYD3_9BURK